MGQHLKLTLKLYLSHVYDLSFSYISAIFLPFFFFFLTWLNWYQMG